MNKKEMIDIIKSEMKHIGKGRRGSPQNLLRVYFNSIRRNDLAKANPEGSNTILKRGIAWIQKTYSDFEPDYDKEFFEG